MKLLYIQKKLLPTNTSNFFFFGYNIKKQLTIQILIKQQQTYLIKILKRMILTFIIIIINIVCINKTKI